MRDYFPPCPELSEETKEWLAARKEAGQKIDPETAEVMWEWAQTLDPYGVRDLPYDCVGREYFARDPGSDIWVSFDDIPDGARHRLWEKHRASLAFPAGLFELFDQLEELHRRRREDPEGLFDGPNLPDLPDRSQ